MRQELLSANTASWVERPLQTEAALDRAPERGRRPCAVLFAPWRGLRERPGFGAPFFLWGNVIVFQAGTLKCAQGRDFGPLTNLLHIAAACYRHHTRVLASSLLRAQQNFNCFSKIFQRAAAGSRTLAILLDANDSVIAGNGGADDRSVFGVRFRTAAFVFVTKPNGFKTASC